jgi:hypothetical protein
MIVTYRITPRDRAIVQRINTMIAESARTYQGDVARTTVLRECWGTINQHREHTGAADVITVSVEHYFYARYRSSEGYSGEFEQRISAWAYDTAKPLLQLFGTSVPRTGRHAPSRYNPAHTYWAQRGIADGAADRSRLNQPIGNVTL